MLLTRSMMRTCCLIAGGLVIMCTMLKTFSYHYSYIRSPVAYLQGLQYFSIPASANLASTTLSINTIDTSSAIENVTHLSLNVSPNISNKTGVKIIYGATKFQNSLWNDILDVENCEYQNCIMKNYTSNEIEKADLVIFYAKLHKEDMPVLPWQIRQNQLWFVMGIESAGYSHNLFPARYNNQFNGTILWRKDSTIYYPWGKAIHKVTNQPYYLMQNKSIPKVPHSEQTNFAAGKNRSAFAYLTNCGSMHYSRRALMLEINKYTPVDIYSTGCTGVAVKKSPCPRLPTGPNPKCEENFNRHHRFFLAFENSLCMDYVTEKFWDRLKSPVYFLPVAMGGLSMEEYTSIAPPDSFLHVDNFTSVKALGEYMKYLTENDEAYNRYHQWRYDYRITTSRSFGSCEVCKLANEKPAMPAIPHIQQWFNDPSKYRSYRLN